MDITKIREDFPILGRTVYGRPLVYLDNAATTQTRPEAAQAAGTAITEEYYSVNANVHRGVHFLSQQATELHEAARETVRRFINARSTNEIVFTRGTTESINLLASSFGEACMTEGDEIIVSTMEHHSNIVPWQLLRERRGIVIRVIPMSDDGRLLPDEYERLFNERTRLVCVAHVSNVLGTVNPVRQMIATAHAHGVPVLVDGAQSVPHMAVDVQALARRAPGGQILDRCIKQQRGLCHAQLLPPLAFSQGVVVEYSRDGLAFDSVLLPELREIEENAAPVVGDHLLEAEGHQTGSAAPN